MWETLCLLFIAEVSIAREFHFLCRLLRNCTRTETLSLYSTYGMYDFAFLGTQVPFGPSCLTLGRE